MITTPALGGRRERSAARALGCRAAALAEKAGSTGLCSVAVARGSLLGSRSTCAKGITGDAHP